MALQPRIIACGNKVATYAMAVRFLAGPAVMTAASFAVGLRGTLLHVAIVQVLALVGRMGGVKKHSTAEKVLGVLVSLLFDKPSSCPAFSLKSLAFFLSCRLTFLPLRLRLGRAVFP